MTGVPRRGIAPLADRRDLIGRVAAACVAEWRHLYADWDEEKARAEFEAERGDGSVPITLLSFDRDDGALLGWVSVIFDDLPGAEHGPWLGNLQVLPEHRGRGVASDLVDRAIVTCRSNGFSRLLLFTESARGLFERHGFVWLRSAHANGVPVDVLSRDM